MAARALADALAMSMAERSLRRALARRPPSTTGSKAPRTVYVRPAPIVVTLHARGNDGEERTSFDD